MLHKKEDYRRWKKEQEIKHKKHISKNGKHWYLGYYFLITTITATQVVEKLSKKNTTKDKPIKQ